VHIALELVNPTEPAEAPPTSPPDPPIPPSAAELERDAAYFVAGLADIRKLLQRMGAALGAVAVAVVAGLGYTHLHDLFPLPGNKSWVGWVALAFGVSAAVGAVGITYRFFRAQRRILILPTTGVDDRERRRFRKSPNDLTSSEVKTIREVYRRYVQRYIEPPTDEDTARITELADALLAEGLELEKEEGPTTKDAPTASRKLNLSEGLRRVTQQTNDSDLSRVQGLADQLRDQGKQDLAERLAQVVKMAQLDAVTVVLEGRSNRAFKGTLTLTFLLLASVGTLGLFAIADYSKSQRPPDPKTTADIEATKVGTALKCVTLQQKGIQLPSVCPPSV
jgi:hypothetical protein